MRNLKLVTVGALALTGFASADFVDVYGASLGAYQVFNITQGGNTENVIAGQIGLVLSNSTGINLDGNWIAYCTEVSQNIYIGGATNTYQVRDVSDLPIPGAGMGTTRSQAIARIYAAAAGAQYTGDSDFAGAFQLAIWEISNDFDGTAGSLDFGNGNFLLNSGLNAGTAANLAFLFNAAANLGGAQAAILGLGHESYQDQIIEITGVIPTPGALALLGLAGVLGGPRRRA